MKKNDNLSHENVEKNDREKRTKTMRKLDIEVKKRDYQAERSIEKCFDSATAQHGNKIFSDALITAIFEFNNN